jgi:hypothetical protein
MGTNNYRKWRTIAIVPERTLAAALLRESEPPELIRAFQPLNGHLESKSFGIDKSDALVRNSNLFRGL